MKRRHFLALPSALVLSPVLPVRDLRHLGKVEHFGSYASGVRLQKMFPVGKSGQVLSIRGTYDRKTGELNWHSVSTV